MAGGSTEGKVVIVVVVVVVDVMKGEESEC